ncbi:Mu transposase C-terminal domain-containing protein [Aliiroseovarius sp.]|uniref:Mu transposase C-terminal domain-containing protein n=1 Tax=Aliiroseovarius sp. TaxID=1872442 RepID=UPI003BAD4774
MSPRIRFDPTDAISINNADYLIREQSGHGLVLQQVDHPSVIRSFTHNEIVELLATPDTRLKRGFFSEQRAVRRLRSGQKYMSAVPKKSREKALWKETVCQVFLVAEQQGEVNRTEDSIKALLPVLKQRVDEQCARSQLLGVSGQAGSEIVTRMMPCPRALLTWVRLYERSGYCPLSLLRKQRSKDSYATKFSREVVKLLNQCIWDYMAEGRATVAKVVRDTRDRFKEENERRQSDGLHELDIPSASEINRRINRFGKFQRKAARYGAAAARREMGFYENGLAISHPLQWVQMDEWKVDVYSLLDDAGLLDGVPDDELVEYEVGRRWIYLAIDVATRCILGFRIAKAPSAVDAISTLSLITMDKTPLAEAAGCESGWHFFGGVGSLSTDTGSAFIADDYRMAVTDLGCNRVAPLAGFPELRGHVERVFGTFASQLMPELTGRSFSNPQERGDYPGETRAALTDMDLVKLFTLFIVDIYHNTSHEGLAGETPANAWARLAKAEGVSPPPDATTWCSVFGVPVQRKVGRHGVRAFGINYLSPEIEDAHIEGTTKPVEVRINPHDLTHVTVFLNGEWFSAKAVSSAVWGLSLDEWQSIVRQLRLKHKREAELVEDVVRRARAKIRKINADAMALRRLSPVSATPEDLERAERDLFMSLSIKPERAQAPVKDAPVGKGLLGDSISVSLPDENSQTNDTPNTQRKTWGFHHD